MTSKATASGQTKLEKQFEDEFNKIIQSKQKQDSCWKKLTKSIAINCPGIANVAYDVLTASISIADITTDIWVIINFYTLKRWTFFWIALIVLIIAQLSYAVAFVSKFVDFKKYAWTAIIQWFFFGLLFSPIMSFIFYFTSDPDMPLSKFFKRVLDLEIEERDKEWHESWATEEDFKKNKKSNISEWIEKKMRKHLGFIMEAVIEALPQSIIQMIAIVYFQETQWVNIASILISLTSVATKSMVFSSAITFGVFIFNWLSLVTDFFGIFCILSWVFYNPTNVGEITNLGMFWIYETLILWAVICIWVLIFLFDSVIIQDWYLSTNKKIREHGTKCEKIATIIGMICQQTILWIGGSLVGVLATSIGLFAPIGMYIASHNDRFSGSMEMNSLALKLFEFIFDENSAKGIHLYDDSISWQQDRTMRICCVIRELHKSEFHKDEDLYRYLLKHEKSSFRDVTLQDIRDNCAPQYQKDAHFVQKFIKIYLHPIRTSCTSVKELNKKLRNPKYTPNKYETVTKLYFVGEVTELIFTLGALYILLPIWGLSRIFYFILPFLCIATNGVAIENLNILQLILTLAYWIMSLLWFINLVRVLNFYYWMHHIGMGRSWFYSWRKNTNTIFDHIHKDFQQMANKIIVNKIINDVYGKDIGSIIFDYWSNFDLTAIEKEAKEDKDEQNKLL